MAEQVALLVELHDGRRLLAARAGAFVGGGFRRVERIGAMDDPDVIVGVDADADRLAEVPAVGQRLGPRRIHFESRSLHRTFRLGVRVLLQNPLTDREHHQQGHEHRADEQVSLHMTNLTTG